jgi:hypothetical protein
MQAIPNSGPWLMEEQPTVAAVRTFLDAPPKPKGEAQ